MSNRINNYINRTYDSIQDELESGYLDMYDDVVDEKLAAIFANYHKNLLDNFEILNQRLPTGDKTAYFWAHSSRDLIAIIEKIRNLRKALENSQFSFSLTDYYDDIINKCKNFLKKTQGSEVPANMESIDLDTVNPIFILDNSEHIALPAIDAFSKLKLIGEGSYAHVHVYFDVFYNKKFATKTAKKDLSDKELERFKYEYEEMSKLRSPYIVEVYSYDDINKRYIMEYMDETLYQYIKRNNNKILLGERKSMVRQLLKGFSYLHSKDLLHRDISPNNILIKKYDDTRVLKISDFGLVKRPESQLTTIGTEMKGWFNDPSLRTEGFSSYSLEHEMYSLTRLCCYVLLGKENLIESVIKDINIKQFFLKGTNPDKRKRYTDFQQFQQAASLLLKSLKQ